MHTHTGGFLKVATPTFLPSSTVHVLSVTISISSSTEDAIIHYTTDGTIPASDSFSLQNGEEIVWNDLGTTTFSAIAVKEGFNASDVATKQYTVVGQCAKPVLSPAGGTFVGSVDVMMHSDTSGAKIYYTLDGVSTPSETAPFVANDHILSLSSFGTINLRAMASRDGMGHSAVTEARYEIQQQVATPTILPLWDVFVMSATLSVECATSNATLFYTTDGSTPSHASLILSVGGSIVIPTVGSHFVQVLGSLPPLVDSEVAVKSIQVLDMTSAPVFDPPGNNASKHYTHQASISLSCATPNATVHYTTDGRSTPSRASAHVACDGGVIVLTSDDTVILRAFATSPQHADSPMVQSRYYLVPKAYEEWPLAQQPFTVQPNVTIQVVEKVIKLCVRCTETRLRGRFVTLANPKDHFSFMEPLRGCGDGTFLPSVTGRAFQAKRDVIVVNDSVDVKALNAQFAVQEALYSKMKHWGCEVVTNGGFFNTTSTACYGDLVTQGHVVQSSPRHNINFGIRNNSFVVGYVGPEEVTDPSHPFDELISGLLWIVRKGSNNVYRSLMEEDMSVQETGSSFATVKSARTVIGHDIHGRLLMLQIEGETWVSGASLYEMGDLAIELGFYNAINLDGGGSATMTQNHSLISDPEWRCNDEPDTLFRCEKRVTTITCVHAAPPPLFKYNTTSVIDDDAPNSPAPTCATYVNTAAPTIRETIAPSLSPTLTPTLAPTATATLPSTPDKYSSAANETLLLAQVSDLKHSRDVARLVALALAACLCLSLCMHVRSCCGQGLFKKHTQARGDSVNSPDSSSTVRAGATVELTTNGSVPTSSIFGALRDSRFHQKTAYNPLGMVTAQTRSQSDTLDEDEQPIAWHTKQNQTKSKAPSFNGYALTEAEDDVEGFYSDDERHFRETDSRTNTQTYSREAEPISEDNDMTPRDSTRIRAHTPEWNKGNKRGWFGMSLGLGKAVGHEDHNNDELNPFTSSR